MKDIHWRNCPKCNGLTIHISTHRQWMNLGSQKNDEEYYSELPNDAELLYPKVQTSKELNRLTEYLPKEFHSDILEAFQVLSISPKASAALSRRCLQRLLRKYANVKHDDLSKEIGQIYNSLPDYLQKTINAIRHYGNFSAHPISNTSTGEIIDVEYGEAEWTLEILQEMINHFIVKPKETENKIEKLNKKLQEAGKPTI